MQVLDEDRGRPLRGQFLEETRPRRVQPLAHGQRVHVLRRGQAEREAEPVTATDPFGGHVRRIAVQDPEMLLQNLAERPVRDPVTVRQAPAAAQQRLRRLAAQPPPEFTKEPGLAHPGITDDRDQGRPAAGDDAAIGLPQVRQLAVAADERRLQAAEPARAHQRQRAHELAAADPAGFARRLDGGRLGELERAARGRHRPLADQDLPRGGRPLQKRADVDCITGGQRAALTGFPRHHIARVHADAQRQPLAEHLPQSPPHPQRCVQGPLRVVLVRRRSPEGRHDRVAGERLDRAPGPLDLRRHRVVEAIKYRPDPLRVLIGRELGRPRQIGEENRRQLPLLSRRGGGPVGAAGEHDRPFAAVQPSLRCLAGVPGPDIAVGVVVRLVQADVPVTADVRSAGAQSLNQASGEHRPRHCRAGQRLSLERVLTGAGGGQHRTAAAVPGQPTLQVQTSTTLAAVGEGAAETAVQDQNLAASPAIVKLVQQPGRRDARARQLGLEGIGGGEVKPATPVQHTVARQVHHHQVTHAAAR